MLSDQDKKQEQEKEPKVKKKLLQEPSNAPSLPGFSGSMENCTIINVMAASDLSSVVLLCKLHCGYVHCYNI